MESFREIKNVLLLVLVLNLAVAGAKGIYGYLSGSISMTADGFHSLFDGTSNVVGLVAIRIAEAPPDPEHPYGHQKFETLATIGIALLLFLASFQIIMESVSRFFEPSVPRVGALSFAVMLASMGVSLSVTLYERRRGHELQSDILLADATHTATDIMTSIAVIVSLVAVRLGYPILDVVVALLIGGLIAWAGVSIVRQSSETLCDAARLSPQRVRLIAENVPGVKEVHQVRTRGRPDNIHVDLHLEVNPHLSIEQAHEIAHRAQDAIENIEGVTDVVVHIEPQYGTPPE